MTKRIVVGIDGSGDSVRAIEWALAEAEIRGADVLALHAWSIPSLGNPYGSAYPPLNIDFEAEAEATLDVAIEQATRAGRRVTIDRRTVMGSAAQALIEASQDAELVVVGSRGLGGFGEFVLGSVGHQVVHHAKCPVVVIPHSVRTAA